ncbi:MAG: HEAT repeat domain-containing protein [Acidobacteriota bacterium]
MDILSIFRGSPQKQVQRARKKVKEPHGDPAVRINAARRLYEMGTPEAISALLERFNINVSPTTQDEEEKQDVLSWIVSFGEKAVPPLIDFLKQQRQVYWPVQALREILPQPELLDKLNEILRYHWDNPPASPEPQVQLIRSLEGFRSEELEETVRLYLQEPDDDVRLAALDFLLEQPEGNSRQAVLQCYLDSEDRPRLRSHILERLAERRWSVKGFRAKIEETLPEGYSLTREGTVKFIRRRF